MPRRIRPTAAPTFTLGWELEAYRGARTVPAGVIAERDGSVSGQGMEYKIAPDYVSRIPESLEALRLLTSDPALHVDRSCGFHVHVGIASRVTAIQRQQWAANFVQIARAVEAMAFQAVPESRRANQYCRPWAGQNQAVSTFHYSPHKYSNSPMRYFWVNVVEMFRPGGIGTVEIRLLGNTKRYAYLLGWIGATRGMANGAWRLIADPSLLPALAESLTRDFVRVQTNLMQQSNNETAYSTAVDLLERTGVTQRSNGLEYTRLLGLANEFENVQQSTARLRNIRAAWDQALAEEYTRRGWAADSAGTHSDALTENRFRDFRAGLRRPAAPAAEPRRPAAPAPVDSPRRPIVEGFDPNAFELVRTR